MIHFSSGVQTFRKFVVGVTKSPRERGIILIAAAIIVAGAFLAAGIIASVYIVKHFNRGDAAPGKLSDLEEKALSEIYKKAAEIIHAHPALDFTDEEDKQLEWLADAATDILKKRSQEDLEKRKQALNQKGKNQTDLDKAEGICLVAELEVRKDLNQIPTMRAEGVAAMKRTILPTIHRDTRRLEALEKRAKELDF